MLVHKKCCTFLSALFKMPPVDSTPHVNTGNFELLYSLKAYDKIPVYEYKSKYTGLTVVIAEVEGPVVDGFFCLGIHQTVLRKLLLNFKLICSYGGFWWRRLAPHSRAFDIFGQRTVSVQGSLGSLGESMFGFWHQCLDRHRSHLLHHGNCWRWRLFNFNANISGPHSVSYTIS